MNIQTKSFIAQSYSGEQNGIFLMFQRYVIVERNPEDSCFKGSVCKDDSIRFRFVLNSTSILRWTTFIVIS